MATPRRLIVDPSVTPWYHCISRCVRRTIIRDDLKRLIIKRMQLLSNVFTIDTTSFGILDTHMHQLLRLDVKRMKNLTRTEVLKRWALLHPPRDADGRPLKNIKPWISEKLKDHKYVNNIRRRLCDLGWYMKELKEWSAIQANNLYEEKGVFWDGRYRSIAILDTPALLASNIYIDLNPYAAGICSLPEDSPFSSLSIRCWFRKWDGQVESSGVSTKSGVENDWLMPIEDRRISTADQVLAGMLEGLTLDKYLMALDETSRLPREGKACLSNDTRSILERIGTNADQWQQAFKRLHERAKPYGVYFSMNRKSLRDAAAARGCHHVSNLNGCETDIVPKRE